MAVILVQNTTSTLSCSFSLSASIPLGKVYHSYCYFAILFLIFSCIFCAFWLLNCYFINKLCNDFYFLHNPPIFVLLIQSICTNPKTLFGCPKCDIFLTENGGLLLYKFTSAPSPSVSSPDNEPAHLSFGRFARSGLSHHR